MPCPQVLRDNRPTLMTCAETFLHDPLVDWTSAKRAGSTTAQAGGVEAENPQVSNDVSAGLVPAIAVACETALCPCGNHDEARWHTLAAVPSAGCTCLCRLHVDNPCQAAVLKYRQRSFVTTLVLYAPALSLSCPMPSWRVVFPPGQGRAACDGGPPVRHAAGCAVNALAAPQLRGPGRSPD